MDDQHNPEFVGNEEKFKYLAIHGYEKFQADKHGRLADGSRLWIKDACRKDGDREYSKLTVMQRYTLDGLRRLTGLHGKWPNNDPGWVVRGLCVGRKESGGCAKAVRALVKLGLVSLSNEPLRSLEGVEGREKKERKQAPRPSPEKTEPKTESSAPVASVRPMPGHFSMTQRTLLDWDEDVGDIPADQIRRAIRWKWKQPENKWIRTKAGPGWVRKNAAELVSEVPPQEMQPKYESKPDPDCKDCSGTGEIVQEDGLYQSSVTCPCVQQVEVG